MQWLSAIGKPVREQVAVNSSQTELFRAARRAQHHFYIIRHQSMLANMSQCFVAGKNLNGQVVCLVHLSGTFHG